MSIKKPSILGLVIALVASNVWWAYRLLDAGVLQAYLNASLENNRDALDQALTLLPVVAQVGVSQEAVISAARPVGDHSEPFEKEDFVWVGRIGLKFDSDGKLVKATRAWDPP